MKIRKVKSLLYIFSSVMVLGLALISFDGPKPDKQTVNLPTQSPTKKPDYTSTPAPTKVPQTTPAPTATSTPTPTPTSTPTPTPTPTPSLAELNAAIAIRPATDDTGISLTTVITDYLTTFYSDEALQVKEISNISCHYKEGLADIDYFVYVSYDITYKGSNVPIPTFEEYLVSIEGETVTVLTETQNEEVKEALKLSRASKELSELYMMELTRCYMNAKLAGDEGFLASLVTDPSYLNMKDIIKKTEYIEEYQNFQFLIIAAPEEVTEFDYTVFYSHYDKIVNIKTLAPGLDEIMITMDDNNYPYVFLGITSAGTDAYRTTLRESETYQEFLMTNSVKPLANAMMQDPDLMEFIERINNATGTTE